MKSTMLVAATGFDTVLCNVCALKLNEPDKYTKQRATSFLPYIVTNTFLFLIAKFSPTVANTLTATKTTVSLTSEF